MAEGPLFAAVVAALSIVIDALWMSAPLLGLTAMPAAIWYAAKLNDMGSCAQTGPIEASARPLLTHDHEP